MEAHRRVRPPSSSARLWRPIKRRRKIAAWGTARLVRGRRPIA
jgi:hypothetical protein